MSSVDNSGVDAEAAGWFAKLNNHRVDLQTLADFHAWRRNPTHDAAYERVQRVWKEAGSVKDDPHVAAALREAKARIAETRQKEGLPFPVPAVTALVVVVVGGYLAMAALGRSAPHVYRTAIGQQRRIELSDGSVVNLDTNTNIEVRFDRRERLVRLLGGQALFDVAHRQDWPFHVVADGLDVQDVGTRFDVRRDGKLSLVTVVSGAVQVKLRDYPQAWTLSAGQQFASGAPDRSPHATDVGAATRWTSGRIEFDDIALAQAVREMNRYAVHPIRLEGAAVEQLRVSGAFDATDTKAFTKALVDVYGVVATVRPDSSTVITAPDPPPPA